MDVATKVIEFLTAVVGLVAAVSAIPKVRRLQCKKRKAVSASANGPML